MPDAKIMATGRWLPDAQKTINSMANILALSNIAFVIYSLSDNSKMAIY